MNEFNEIYLQIYGSALALTAHVEVDQILAHISTRSVTDILDAGCGQGRHAFELARRGYSVVGIDNSATLIATAISQSDGKKNPAFVEKRYSDLSFNMEFDVVACLYTSFGYFERNDEYYETIVRFRDCLRPGGTLIIEAINPLSINEPEQSSSNITTQDGSTVRRVFNYEKDQRILRSSYTIEKDGRLNEITHKIQLFDPYFLQGELLRAGFHSVEVCNGFASSFTNDPFGYGRPFGSLIESSRRYALVAKS